MTRSLITLISVAALAIALASPVVAQHADVGDPNTPRYVRGDVKQPVPLNNVAPRYTDAARASKIEGIVVAQGVVTVDGKFNVQLVAQRLPLGLTEAALAAMSQLEYQPATLNGVAVSVYMNLTMRFELHNSRFSAEIPKFIERPLPVFSDEDKAGGEKGHVLMWLTVSPNGRFAR